MRTVGLKVKPKEKPKAKEKPETQEKKSELKRE